MHAEPAISEQGEETHTQQPEAETVGHEAARVLGSIMDVLMPATPPQPKNARIVRQFDLEAAKTDPCPVAVAVAAPAAKRAQPEHRTREEARAYRNRSLRAAAGLD